MAERPTTAATPDVLVVADVAAWRAWLDAYESECDGVWLTLAKKGTTSPTSLTYAEALDEALCSGWIDGQSKSVDDATYLRRFTPRRTRSMWSKRNVEHVGRLIDEGRMRPRGTSEIDRAKADGRWESAYEGSATIQVPDDLDAALAADDAARATFATLNSQNRFSVLHRIITARTPETRQRRLDRLVAMLARGETLHPQ